MIKIYFLQDPRNIKKGYIGKTEKTLEQRFKWHMNTIKYDRSYARVNWLRKLDSLGLKPEITLIEEINENIKWQDRERFWINYYKKNGYELLNLTEGGDGGPDRKGWIPSDSTRAIWSQQRKGRTPPNKGKKTSEEVKEKISKGVIEFNQTQEGKEFQKRRAEKSRGHIPWNKGKQSPLKGISRSPETIEKMRQSQLGKKLTEEHKQKISESHKGKIPWNKGKPMSDEQKLKLSIAHKGKTHKKL